MPRAISPSVAAAPAAPSTGVAPKPAPAPDPAGIELSARVARERLVRRLVGLAVLTVVVTAASALLPPRGSAARTAPVPDEGAAGVEVQTVPLGGLSSYADNPPPPVTPPSVPVEPQEATPMVAPATRTAAEFVVDTPSPASDVPTLKDRAAEAFDERRLSPGRPEPVKPVATKPPVPVVAPRPSVAAAPPEKRATGETGAGRSTSGPDAWVVQVGVFSTRAKADSVVQQMRGAGLPTPLVESVQLTSGATRFRVRIPTGSDAETARTVRDRVNALPGSFGAAVKSVPTAG